MEQPTLGAFCYNDSIIIQRLKRQISQLKDELREKQIYILELERRQNGISKD